MEEPALTLTLHDLHLISLILKTYPAKPNQQEAVMHLYERISAYLER